MDEQTTTATAQQADEAQAPTPPISVNGTVGHVYDVEPNGQVKDWRRPDPTPELSQGVITALEADFRNGTGQVGDPVIVDGRDGVVREFSFLTARQAKAQGRPNGFDVWIVFADGAEPKERKLNPANVDLNLDKIDRPPSVPRSQQTTAYGVPTDASFGDEDVKEAGDLRQMAVKLIQETEDFPHFKTLADRLAYFWAKKGGSSGGQPTLYRVRFSTKHERRANGWRVVVTFSADVARTLLLQQDVIEAMVHESLCTVERDEHGNLRKVAPNFRGYSANVDRFGTLVPPVRRAAEALNIQVQDVRNLRLDLDATEEVDVGV